MDCSKIAAYEFKQWPAVKIQRLSNKVAPHNGSPSLRIWTIQGQTGLFGKRKPGILLIGERTSGKRFLTPETTWSVGAFLPHLGSGQWTMINSSVGHLTTNSNGFVSKPVIKANLPLYAFRSTFGLVIRIFL